MYITTALTHMPLSIITFRYDQAYFPPQVLQKFIVFIIYKKIYFTSSANTAPHNSQYQHFQYSHINTVFVWTNFFQLTLLLIYRVRLFLPFSRLQRRNYRATCPFWQCTYILLLFCEEISDETTLFFITQYLGYHPGC